MPGAALGAFIRWRGFGAGTILLLAPLITLSQQKGPNAEAGRRPGSTPPLQQPNAAPDVVLSGHMSRESAGPGEIVRFWITLENRSDKPVEKVWLEHLDVPGFSLVRRCWSDSRADLACYANAEPVAPQAAACAGNGQALPPPELCELVAPKQTLTIWGDVQFASPAPRSSDFAVVRWTSGNSTSRAVVSLGQVESFGKIRSIWEAVTGEWQVGVAVWIAILSGLYALWKTWREGEAQRHATEFEQRRNTWNLLLLKVHRLAFRHYMPIVSTVQGVLLYLERLRISEGNPEENVMGAFCYLLRFHWRMRKMKRAGASWYFKDLTAEELVVAMVQTHRRSWGLSDLRRQAALDEFLEHITEDTTVARMLAYLETISGRQAKFWSEFQEWMKDVQRRQDAAALLSALTKIINYETNRPYFYWYGQLRAIDWKQDELLKVREVAAASEGGQKGITERVEKYLKDASRDQLLK
jgi:hypothetical protein